MKKIIKFILLILVMSALSGSAFGQDTIIRYKKVLIPNYVNFQYAGNYGAYDLGIGYYLNKKQTIELNLGYGYTSKHKAAYRIHNLFAKGIIILKRWEFDKGWTLVPQTGVAISRQFAGAGNTFTRLPKTYPDGYYAPNAFRFHFNLGIKVRKYISEDFFIKAVELYTEITTNDLYLTYYFKSSEVKMYNIFSMAIGVNFILFDRN